jgi:hypothetical protein
MSACVAERNVMPMFMNAAILSVKLNDFLIVEAQIFDKDEEQTYKGEIVGGLPGLDELLQLKKRAQKQGDVTEDQLQALASQVVLPPTFEPLSLRVRRVKEGKAGFKSSLICELMTQ